MLIQTNLSTIFFYYITSRAPIQLRVEQLSKYPKMCINTINIQTIKVTRACSDNFEHLHHSYVQLADEIYKGIRYVGLRNPDPKYWLSEKPADMMQTLHTFCQFMSMSTSTYVGHKRNCKLDIHFNSCFIHFTFLHTFTFRKRIRAIKIGFR